MAISKTILTTWINNTLAEIDAIQAAITAISTGGIKEYTLNTGQSEQKVTKLDVPKLEDTVTRLMSRVEDLCAKRDGGNVAQVRPNF